MYTPPPRTYACARIQTYKIIQVVKYRAVITNIKLRHLLGVEAGIVGCYCGKKIYILW